MNKITSFSICKNGLEHAFKSPTLIVITEPNVIMPLVYFRKPAHMTDQQFQAVVDDISNQIKGLSSETVKVLESDDCKNTKEEM